MHNLCKHVANRLATNGWYVGESIFSAGLSLRLAMRVRVLMDEHQLHVARVGRGDGVQRNASLRSDETHWLTDTPEDASEFEATNTVQALRLHLNEALFLGAQGAELHFARYAPGAFYRTHRDRFRDDDARLVSLVFYLNEAWPNDVGGELLLYADNDHDGVIARVRPQTGTMVCFMSERFPHEVLPATRERYSLTGWLRRA